MTNKLKEYFPMIRTREEILGEIHGREELLQQFNGWDQERRERFLDMCTGVRGAKILYDFMFKEIFNPESDPGRLETLIGCVLGQSVHIREILPNDSTRLADETTLLITDIVVEFESGAIGNVEVQKIGYAFPGQRSACYSADLLLRQYKRLRDKKKKWFSYRDVQQVYTIVFFEKSPKEFHAFPDSYLHRFEQASDTGLRLELLQKFYFIALDIFQEIHQNKDSRNELEAWLTFLSTDDPEMIIRLVESYPKFRPLYEDIYGICQNMEDIMGLFSKELQIMDRNTTKIMIDEMQETIDGQKDTIDEMQGTIDGQKDTIDEMQDTINRLQEQEKDKDQRIRELEAELERQKRQKQTEE